MDSSFIYDVTWVRHETMWAHWVLFYFKYPYNFQFLFTCQEACNCHLSYFGILYGETPTVGVHNKSALFNIYCFPLYNPCFPTSCYITSCIIYQNNDTGRSIYYVMYVQSFVNMFEENCVDRNAENNKVMHA